MSLIKTNGGFRTRNLIPKTPFLDDFFTPEFPAFSWINDNNFDSNWMPDANIKEDKKEFVVELSVPGYEKKDIHVEVNNNVLRISGEREDQLNEETENYTCREFSYGSFTRSFQLPETIKEEKITAQCNNGILSVELPKNETAILKKAVKEIEIA